MIFDTVENIKNYKGLGRVFDALKFLAETDFSGLPVGKYQLDGDNIYYMVQEYDTKLESKIEAHKKYIDIQAILSGDEIIGVAPISVQKTLIEERLEKDCYYYECNVQPIVLNSGSFMVLYPNDLHKPGLAVDAPAPCRKVVIKVKCDE